MAKVTRRLRSFEWFDNTAVCDWWWQFVIDGGSLWLMVAVGDWWWQLVIDGGSLWLMVAVGDWWWQLVIDGGSWWLMPAICFAGIWEQFRGSPFSTSLPRWPNCFLSRSWPFYFWSDCSIRLWYFCIWLGSRYYGAGPFSDIYVTRLIFDSILYDTGTQ